MEGTPDLTVSATLELIPELGQLDMARCCDEPEERLVGVKRSVRLADGVGMWYELD